MFIAIDAFSLLWRFIAVSSLEYGQYALNMESDLRHCKALFKLTIRNKDIVVFGDASNLTKLIIKPISIPFTIYYLQK